MNNLPNDIYWNIFKYLRHPVAEIFVNHPAYNVYLSTKGDMYIDSKDVVHQINDLISFYNIWKVCKRTDLFDMSDTSSETESESESESESYIDWFSILDY
jgi:hypothetical protein